MVGGMRLCIGPCKQRPYTVKYHADGDCAGNNNHADLLRFSGWCRLAGKHGGVPLESADEAVPVPVIFGAIDEVNEAAQMQSALALRRADEKRVLVELAPRVI